MKECKSFFYCKLREIMAKVRLKVLLIGVETQNGKVKNLMIKIVANARRKSY